MAETPDRQGLTVRSSAGGPRVWLARLGATLAIAVIVGMGYRGLRLTGFQFRWESGPSSTSPATAEAASSAPRLSTSASGSSGPVSDGDASTVDADRMASVLEPPAVGQTSARRPPNSGAARPVRIDFETFWDGSPICAPCSVSDEWARVGLRVSFRSWTAASTRPYLLDGREYLPPEAGTYALGPAFGEGMGLEVGVIRLDFPGRPGAVSFTLYGPDIVPHFAVSAWTGDQVLNGAIERTGGRTYDVTGRGLFREERVTIRADAGIDRVSLDGWGPPGHMVLIDDLEIIP